MSTPNPPAAGRRVFAERPVPAARAADTRSVAHGRRPTSERADDQLRRLSDRLDMLIRDVGLGARSHREHERNVEAAEAIADGIRAVFRKATSAQPVNAPLWQQGGRAWF